MAPTGPTTTGFPEASRLGSQPSPELLSLLVFSGGFRIFRPRKVSQTFRGSENGQPRGVFLAGDLCRIIQCPLLKRCFARRGELPNRASAPEPDPSHPPLSVLAVAHLGVAQNFRAGGSAGGRLCFHLPPTFPGGPFWVQFFLSHSHWSKANRALLTFWFLHFGPFLVMAPKGEPFISRSFGQLSLISLSKDGCFSKR